MSNSDFDDIQTSAYTDAGQAQTDASKAGRTSKLDKVESFFKERDEMVTVAGSLAYVAFCRWAIRRGLAEFGFTGKQSGRLITAGLSASYLITKQVLSAKDDHARFVAATKSAKEAREKKAAA